MRFGRAGACAAWHRAARDAERRDRARFAAATGPRAALPAVPDNCLARPGSRPHDCPAPATPAITFEPGSAAIPHAELAVLDRVVSDSSRFAVTVRLMITADAARLEPEDLARRRVDAVRDALVARGAVTHASIVTVTSAAYMLDELPAPPDDRVEIDLRGCRS